MRTQCDRCSAEIEDTEVNACARCERDGLCNDCYAAHDCEGGGKEEA